jgi:geranylgeranyl diphosphate synthase type II
MRIRHSETPGQLSHRLLTRRALLDHKLERALNVADGAPDVLHEAMRYCVCSGGKRFRPLLCLGACEVVGGRWMMALPVACAIELLHTYSLVHDDLPAMDNADERRGKPSCHRRFGEATAILVGDALLTKAFELLSTEGIANARAILRIVGQAAGTAGLIGGQILDLECGMWNVECGMEKLEEVARRKTAALITASVVTGGLAGRAPMPALAALRRYGLNLGVAFQLVDDVHDDDGFVRLMGSETLRQRARGLVDQAKRALDPFGRRAWVLLELADWLAHEAA